MYLGILDSSEIDDYRTDGRQKCGAVTTVVINQISGAKATGRKVVLVRRSIRVPLQNGYDKTTNAPTYTEGAEASVYFTSFHARTKKVIIHSAIQKYGIAGYFTTGSTLETHNSPVGTGQLGVGESFEDSKTGYSVTVRAISDTSATVDLSFCGDAGSTDSCNFELDGMPCSSGTTPLPSVCKSGACQVIGPGIKCGRYLDVKVSAAAGNTFPSFLVGRYVRQDGSDDSLHNGRVQYLKLGGMYAMRLNPYGYVHQKSNQVMLFLLAALSRSACSYPVPSHYHPTRCMCARTCKCTMSRPRQASRGAGSCCLCCLFICSPTSPALTSHDSPHNDRLTMLCTCAPLRVQFLDTCQCSQPGKLFSNVCQTPLE